MKVTQIFIGLAFAFTAGLLSLFSPCAFPLLPGYISYYIGENVPRSKAALGGVSCMLGLITIFSAFGLVASIIGDILLPFMSIFVMIAGLIVIALGVSFMLNVQILSFHSPFKASRRKGYIGFYLFGIAYGFAASACTAPIFLSILVYAVTLGGHLNGLVTFLIYAFGMGLPLIVLSILATEAKNITYQKISRFTPTIQKVSGIILIALGCYLMVSQLILI